MMVIVLSNSTIADLHVVMLYSSIFRLPHCIENELDLCYLNFDDHELIIRLV
jgi:hypothetical protein